MKDDLIYRKGHTQWTSCVKGASTIRSNPTYFQHVHSVVVPTGKSLTTVEIISDGIVIFEGTDFTDIDDIPPSITVKCDPFWVLDNSNINTRCNEKWVAQGLLEGNLRVLHDGFYKSKVNDRGITAAWIVEDEKSTSNITCTIATSGTTSDPCRGELLYTHSILSTIRHIEKYSNNFTVGSIKVECDNEKAG